MERRLKNILKSGLRKACASLAMLHYAAPADLARMIPGYRPAGNREGLATDGGHFPSAAYLRVTG